ncbi:DUF1700 domain-containing protein [Lachnotalea sp. AF33-28]|uniref:DUF1700 domain-containing protein n=1 Tax=Lachnotalea sp. AF33-28 TaxID=2292046 RepID=UPI001314C519|nr:DUF1700 domain-containing protein [Lachnotalea sp. AF33-28]
MNRNEYLEILDRQLRRLPADDREKAMEYYREYFDEAGPEQEEAAVEELGDPREVARQLITGLAVKKLDQPEKSAKKGLSALWVIILAIFAAPFGLPLAFGVALVIMAACLCAALFVGCILLAGVCLIAGGALSVLVGIYLLFMQPAGALANLGLGLMCTGIGILVLYASIKMGKWCGRRLSAWLKKRLAKNKG